MKCFVVVANRIATPDTSVKWFLVIPLLLGMPWFTWGQESGGLDEIVPMWASGPEHAAELMREVREAIPNGPMVIEANIRAKERINRPESRLQAQVRMETRGERFQAVYRIHDHFGSSTDELTVTREPDAPPSYQYRRGDPLAGEELPDLSSAIHHTDFTWIDLSLSYLWWPGGDTIGTDRTRGHFCYIVEVAVPADLALDAEVVRLWVEPKRHMLLRAEAYDADRVLVRRLSVESFRKIEDVWFVKDIDVVGYPERTKTTMRVESVSLLPTPTIGVRSLAVPDSEGRSDGQERN